MTSWVPVVELYPQVHLVMEWFAGERQPHPYEHAASIREITLVVRRMADATKPDAAEGVEHMLDIIFMDRSGRRYALFLYCLDETQTRCYHA